jgi:histidinol-phosphate aminotransferase
MINTDKLVRQNILDLKPYKGAAAENIGRKGILLDANENPFGDKNRYPDLHQHQLRKKLSVLNGLDMRNIMIGNGSDELIDMTFRIFCRPGKDKVIICPPTFGMYEVFAQINDAEVINIPLKGNFQPDSQKILATGEEAKILFLCSPNNPTGNSFNDLEHLVQNFPGIVFLDEAYIDFSKQESLLAKINDYPNLIVSQTFSKARALAAARIGMIYAGEKIISYFQKVRAPFNISRLNTEAALKALENNSDYTEAIGIILNERKRLEKFLGKLSFVKKIYPSDANFILAEFEKADFIHSELAEKGIMIRNRSSQIKDCLRISIGTPQENDALISALKQL